MRRDTMILAGLALIMALSGAGALTSLAAEAGWTSDGGVWRYTDSSGSYVTNTWKTSGESSFYLGSDGTMAADTWIDDTYYVGADGAMVKNAWIQMTEESSGKEPGWYYLGSSGKAEEDGWKTIGDYKYCFDDDGKMRTGWYFDDDNIYYLGDENDGSMKTGWRCLGYDEDEEPEEGDISQSYSSADESAKWFYFQSSGKAKKAESGSYASLTIDNKKYYFDENGLMATGWVAVNEAKTGDSTGITKFVYLGDENDGTMAKSQWKYLTEHPGDSDDSSEISSAASEDGPQDGDGEWYYFQSSGVPAFLDSTADTMSEATTKVSGTSYFFDWYGCMKTGLIRIGTDGGDLTGYFGPESGDGKMRTGRQTGVAEDGGDSYTYYFASSGSNKGAGYSGTQDGYLYDSGRLVKADDDMDYQVFEVNDRLYLVNESGKVQTSSKSYKVNGDYRYKITGGTLYLIDDDQDVIGEVDAGEAETLPAITYDWEFDLN